MSIGLLVTRGFGNGTLVGTIPFAVTAGYDIGVPVVTPDVTFGVYGAIQSRGQSVTGIIDPNGQGVEGEIT